MKNENTKTQALETQDRRLLDPFNYKESCYRLIWEKKYKNINIPSERIICWLGSYVGQSFLRDVHDLIEKYPYKENCSFVYMNGVLVNSTQLLLHYCWFIEHGTDDKEERYIEHSFPIEDCIYHLMSDGRIVNNKHEQNELNDNKKFNILFEKVRKRYFEILNINL